MMTATSNRFTGACLALLILGALAGCSDRPLSEDEFLQQAREKAQRLPETQETQTAMAPPVGKPDELPRIELETTHYDLGLIDSDRMANGSIKVYNRGEAPLRISRITTSCHCTEGQMVEDTIPPGGEGTLRITVDPYRIVGFDSTKTLTLFTNDLYKRQVSLDVSAHVEPELALEPAEFDFGAVPVGESASLTMRIAQLNEGEFELGESKLVGLHANQVFQVSTAKVPVEKWAAPDKEEFEVTITVAPNIRPAPYAASMVIDTNLKRVRKLYIPVRVTIEEEGSKDS